MATKKEKTKIEYYKTTKIFPKYLEKKHKISKADVEKEMNTMDENIEINGYI